MGERTLEDRLAGELEDRDAAAVVHVGDRRDADFAYCAGPVDARGAVVLTGERAVLCAPAGDADRAERSFRGDAVRTFDPRRRHPGQAAADVLADAGVEGTVLAPPAIPHDAALYLERAGHDLTSTDVVARARERKSDEERERIADAQSAASAGLERAREVLAAATAGDGRLRFEGETLTAERLRRHVDAAMAAAGADPARNTRIGVGGPPVDPGAAEAVPLRPATTIGVAVAPREPGGYHGALERTVVVDGDGGWERRAHVAVTNAREAALATLSEGAGVDPATVREEIVAELGAYGFDPTPETGDVVADLGGGVGIERRERPDLRSDEELSAGAVLAIRPGLADPERGHVALTDLVAVTGDGARSLGDHSLSIVPDE